MNYSNENNPAEFSVAELMGSGHYTVPIYQRNYAWGEVEIVQLLQDLVDAVTHDPQWNNYYIGSLVVHKHSDGHFEIIDGQQRHTTLCILLAVLKNEYTGIELSISELNLDFDCRTHSKKTLNALFHREIHFKHESENLEPSIYAAYKITHKYLSKIFEGAFIVPINFTNFLLNNVKLLRVIVPDNTDLNHYFEIMNNRGEQLEKHEILKARLMNSLNASFHKGFSKLWDACADMHRRVQLGFSNTERSAVFGADWNECPETFADYLGALVPVNTSTDSNVTTATIDEEESLTNILKSPSFKNQTSTFGTDKTSKFGSVINFQNFLLQVLLVETKNEKISLDDKRLLEIFDQQKNGGKFSKLFVENFSISLLRMRLLFDRFIIKSDNDKWSLKNITCDEKNSGYYSTKSFSEADINDRLEMILSMFHVSYPTQSYKHWLSAAIYYLYTNIRNKSNLFIDGINYLIFLECLSDKFFFGQFGTDTSNTPARPIDYHQLVFSDANVTLTRSLADNIVNRGTHVENFIFNRLDYLLWKRAKNNQESARGHAIQDFDQLVKNFRFTNRSSVEHYYPQNPRDENVPKLSNCDNFGNLCLISHHNNSRYSDFLPNAKIQLRASSKSNESLKQLYMMSYGDKWGPGHEAIMTSHENDMVAILCSRSNCAAVSPT